MAAGSVVTFGFVPLSGDVMIDSPAAGAVVESWTADRVGIHRCLATSFGGRTVGLA
jgi:hypothetical protein